MKLHLLILWQSLIRSDMKKGNIKSELPSVHYISSDNKAMITSSVERIKDLTEIPSPYLEGKDG